MKLLGYIRVSGAGQVEKDGPVRQKAAIGAFAKQNQAEIIKYFSDPGVSGTVDGVNRPGFFEMIESAADLGAEGIIVEKMDRLARDLLVSEMIFRELRARNLKLYSVEQGLVDFSSADSDPSRKLIRQVFAAIAEYDKAMLVVKLRAARVRKRQKFGRCEGPAPFGHKSNNERYILKAIITAREGGGSFKMIARNLNMNGTKRANGKVGTWDASSVSKIYKNAVKERKRVEQYEHVPNNHAGEPAITSGGERQDQDGGGSPCPAGESDERREVGQWLPMPP